MENKFKSTEFFYSSDPKEIEKEMRKQQALHSLFPYSTSEDKTNYVLLTDEQPKQNTYGLQKATRLSKDSTKNASNFENDEKELNFDPWKREKTLDRMRVIKYPKLNGEFGTQIIDRAPYHENEIAYISNAKFNSVIDKSLKSEGGYSNSPIDRGGETNFGITKIFMEDYKYALPGGKSIPIKDLTVEDAKKLYKAMWDRYNLWQIRDKNLAYVINDYMINSYAGTVAKRIQGILKQVPDGHIGSKSLETINSSDAKWLVDEILKNRYYNYREYVKKRPNQIGNYAGWINRLNGVAEEVGSELRFSTKY